MYDLSDSDKAIKRYSNNSLSPRPDYYSGEGANECDLRPQLLRSFYDGLIKDFSAEAGKNFCLMLEDLTDLSLTNFLRQFKHFYRCGRKWLGKLPESRIDIEPDSGDIVGIVTVISVLSDESSNWQRKIISERIKKTFFDLIGYVPKEKEELMPLRGK